MGSVSLKLVLPAVVFTVLLFLGIVGLGLKAQRRPPTTGLEALAGQAGRVIRLEDAEGAEGRRGVVEVFGEYWPFDAEAPLRAGERVVVTGYADGRVRVRPVDNPGG